MLAAAEEFEHSIKGFEDANEKNRDNEVIGRLISVIGEFPVKEDEEKTREREPFEELDFGGKREKTEGRYSGLVIGYS